jgi:hypothetical protein
MAEGEGKYPQEDTELEAPQDTEGEPVTRGKFLGSAAAAAAAATGAGALFVGDAAAAGTAPPVYRYTDYKPDIKGLRIPGVAKSFDQLTISELVQLRPSDMNSVYEINAVTANVSITTSALLNELSHIRSNAALDKKLPAMGANQGVSVKIHKTHN